MSHHELFGIEFNSKIEGRKTGIFGIVLFKKRRHRSRKFCTATTFDARGASDQAITYVCMYVCIKIEKCVQEDAIYAINANATKTVHETNSAIAIASFMNDSVALLSCVRCALKFSSLS